MVDLDTSHFKGNAPGWAQVTGLVVREWVRYWKRTRLQPDTRHRFLVRSPPR
jgi:allantoicase